MSKDNSKVVKASMTNDTATSTERHNSREMYEKKDGRYDVSKNFHWDCYNCGSSFEAEKQFYDENFSSVLEAQNERYIKQRHYENVLTMDEYHRKHMPQEMIFQIGNLANQKVGIDIDDSWCKEAISKVAEKLESVGCKVISWDLHNDEATPHVHLRWSGIDVEGKPNVSGCLFEHGIEPPDMSKLKYTKKGKPRFTQYNNPKQTLLKDIRAELDELGREWCDQRGYEFDDQNRTKRKHQTVNEYKREQLRKDVVKLEDTIEEQKDKYAKAQEQIDSSIEFAAQQNEEAVRLKEENTLAKTELELAKQEREETIQSQKKIVAGVAIGLKEMKESKEAELKAIDTSIKEQTDELDKLNGEIENAKRTKANLIKKTREEAEEEAKQIKEQAKIDAQKIRDNAQAEANDFLDNLKEAKELFNGFVSAFNKMNLFKAEPIRKFAEAMKKLFNSKLVLEREERLRVNTPDTYSSSYQLGNDRQFGD